VFPVANGDGAAAAGALPKGEEVGVVKGDAGAGDAPKGAAKVDFAAWPPKGEGAGVLTEKLGLAAKEDPNVVAATGRYGATLSAPYFLARESQMPAPCFCMTPSKIRPW
jgi:hypothetical protein